MGDRGGYDFDLTTVLLLRGVKRSDRVGVWEAFGRFLNDTGLTDDFVWAQKEKIGHSGYDDGG